MPDADSSIDFIDDFELMRRIYDGDAASLGVLYDRHSGLLYALGLRILSDHAEAEDFLAELFWEIWKRADRYDPDRGAPLTYLVTLARSRAIDFRRSAGYRHRSLEPLPADAPRPSEGSSENPANDAILTEQRERIAGAMARLEPAQRQAVELSFFDGLSHSEIADRLGKPLGTIKTCIRQGLIHLRDGLRSTYGPKASD